MKQRQAWYARLAQVDHSRLVFLDETGAKTNMTRLYARAKKGERAVDYAPHGHWSTTTLVAALSAQGAMAPMVLDGPIRCHRQSTRRRYPRTKPRLFSSLKRMYES